MINITEAATVKITELIDTNAGAKNVSPDELFLRVYVAGGGCSGVQFGMALTSQKRDDDETINQSGIQLLVDPVSKTYLEGAEVDFISHELGPRFKITPSEDVMAQMGSSCGTCGGGC